MVDGESYLTVIVSFLKISLCFRIFHMFFTIG